jgi:hypothetical protein
MERGKATRETWPQELHSNYRKKRKCSSRKLFHMDLPENYNPTYPQATVLKDRDIQRISKEYIT